MTSTNTSNDTTDCVVATIVFFLSCSIGAGYIAWIVYTIMGLVQVSDATINSHCGSLLWRYALTMIILTIVQARASKPRDDEEPIARFIGLIFSYLLAIGLASWGTYELIGRSCTDSLTIYTLYPATCAIVIIQWLFVTILTFLVIIMTIWTQCCAARESPPLPPTNHLTYGPDGNNI